MNPLRRILLNALSPLSLKSLLNFSSHGFFAPFYHTVSDEYLPHIAPLYSYPNVARFRSDLDLLLKHFKFLTLDELIVKVEKNSFDRRDAFLSFDDGLLGCYTIVREILLEKGIPATFFVNPAFIDTDKVFYRYKSALLLGKLGKSEFKERIKEGLIAEGIHGGNAEISIKNLGYRDQKIIDKLMEACGISLSNKQVYMCFDQLKEMESSGFSIGAHSMDHPEFSSISKTERLTQVRESILFCENSFSSSRPVFAFPFYDYKLSESQMKEIYAEGKVKLSFGTSGLKRDVFQNSIQRLPMETEVGSGGDILKDAILRSAVKAVFGRNIIKR